MIGLARVFCLLFIATSGYTLGISGGSTNSILRRLNPADLFASFGILATLMAGINLRYDRVANGWIAVCIAFLPGIFFSGNTGFTVSELLALLLLTMFYLSASNIFSSKDIHLVLTTFAVGSLIPSVIGIVDIMTPFLASVELGKGSGVMRSSTFRNGGQAGEFLLIVLSVLIPLRLSSLYKATSLNQKVIYDLSLSISFIFFLLTIKVASYIGLAVSFGLLAIHVRRLDILLFVIASGLGTFFLWRYFSSEYEGLASWMEYRVSARLGSSEIFSPGGFIYDNFMGAYHAFSDNPFFGSGIGGVWKVYHENEIHSTYVKIVGETGIIGMWAYCILMYSVWENTKVPFPYTEGCGYSDFLYIFIPFFGGCAVSWWYTYHLRKREFVILLLIISLVKLGARENSEMEISCSSASIRARKQGIEH